MQFEIKNQKVAVVGLGRTAVSLCRLLQEYHAKPFVTEMREQESVREHVAVLEEMGVPYECGGHTPAAFADAYMVIPSPGVSPHVQPIQDAVAAGSRLVGELELAYAFCRSKIIAVTGTNGKTTTTEWIDAMLRACGHTTLLTGNNALPFSQAVQHRPQPDYMVVEVSSYQLELVRDFHPWIGVLLNVREDHVDRYSSIEEYAATKARLFARQEVDDHAVFNCDDEHCQKAVYTVASHRWPISLSKRMPDSIWYDEGVIRHGDEAIAALSDLQIQGDHNIENAMAALAVMRAGGFAWDSVIEGLRGFGGVEHRMEFVDNLDGIRFVNDSKSTNLDSLRAALNAQTDSVVLIMGGRSKGEDYEGVGDLVEEKCRALVLIGEEARPIKRAIGKRVKTCITAKNMSDAVLRATGASPADGVVLFSPGCSSFDMYENFEQRGHAFKDSVGELARVRRLAEQTLDRR